MLHIGANHLGNIKDTPPRVIELLKTVDYVVVEFEEVFLEDIKKLQIPTPNFLVAIENDEFSEKVIELLKDNKSVLLLTQHGYAGTADPGHMIVNLAIEEGISINMIPGPSIGPMALAASGWATRGNVLIETFGQSSEQIESRLSKLSDLEYPIIVLDHKEAMLDIVKIANRVLPSREVLLCINLGWESDQKIIRLNYEDMIDLLEKSTLEELLGPLDNLPVTTLIIGSKYVYPC
jgi:16S rRNA (cytidine1402-2'-O)-methyltransferase